VNDLAHARLGLSVELVAAVGADPRPERRAEGRDKDSWQDDDRATWPAAAWIVDARTLDAYGTNCTPVADRKFGPGHYLRPNFFQPNRCKNVLVEGVHIRRSPMWEINPVMCTNVTVRGLDIGTP